VITRKKKAGTAPSAPPPKRPPVRGSAKARRTAARLAAVQALYQQAQTGQSAIDIVQEFMDWRVGHTVDGVRYVSADPTLFTAIVRGTEAKRGELDQFAGLAMESRDRFDRLELLLQAILRAGLYELVNHSDVDTALIIKEYVDVAAGFYGGPEPGLINGVLDRAARVLRESRAEAG
jgi:transcription antitermination protein NusB